MYRDIDFLNGNIKFCESDDSLKEDILQVEYPNSIILDVGWYGAKGYVVMVVENYNWEKYLFYESTKNKIELKMLIEKAIQYIKDLSNQKSED